MPSRCPTILVRGAPSIRKAICKTRGKARLVALLSPVVAECGSGFLQCCLGYLDHRFRRVCAAWIPPNPMAMLFALEVRQQSSPKRPFRSEL